MCIKSYIRTFIGRFHFVKKKHIIMIITITLLGPAYLSLSKDRGGHIVPPLNILGLGGVRVPIRFGYDLLWNDLPHSKGFMKFGCLEPSKITIHF